MAKSLNSNRPVNSPLHSALRTPPATYPTGHLSTGNTPAHFKPLPTSANELTPVVDKKILEELHGNIIAIKPEAFVWNLMYGRAEDRTMEPAKTTGPLSRSECWARDRDLAMECLGALANRQYNQKFNRVVASLVTGGISFPEVMEGISPYTSNKFTKLENANREGDLYKPLVALFQFVDQFFRCYFLELAEEGDSSVEVDKTWPIAVDPKEHQLDQEPPKLLRRGFFDTHDKQFRFSHHLQEPPVLQPDISFVLYEKAENAELPEFEELHWKDVKVPIEVKLKDGFDADRVCQMARYARAIQLEQFDRNFTFSILVSRNKCRVSHWDASHCHVAEVDMHAEPETFIQIIGRLASMDPQSMGYDARFSNFGRVLASQSEEMATTLDVVCGTPTQYHDQRPETHAQNTIVLDLFVDRPLFETRGYLFSRFTRVWEGRDLANTNLEDPEAGLRVVKQNWADVQRVSEAFLYEKTNEVPNVARLVGSEARSHTIDIVSTWSDGNFMGVYRKGSRDVVSDKERFELHKCDKHPEPFRRVLARMIFKGKGRSNTKARDCQELLEATKQWVTGLWGLNEKGIIHRDVSSGNLLLGRDMNSPAFIIDLGLAHWSGSNKGGSSSESGDERTAKSHHHLTGTLPFIAHDLVAARNSIAPVRHELRHDIESVYWVLLYLALREESSDHAKDALKSLLSTEVHVVKSEKRAFLSGVLDPEDNSSLKLIGRFKDLTQFLVRFAGLFWKNNRALQLEEIINLIETAISALPLASGEVFEDFESDVVESARGSKQKQRSVESLEEQVGGVSHQHASSDSRNVRLRFG
ncbi:hypothetical protein M407DRAFT_20742 [Tulasnella calospora MUT 4182]|uniref:Protein kinase domain-containing protein n=1 Tax=Tulasnella calospora MUT 4182 TaxID=1051891 RepID=A0A0C3QFQ0_9AGAM|nr:hypothetical protein M407DRAFT_28439 [Tulasnella calospora MUT 4182]KIO30280.1 hypothetical protein M407DRAFT_20742 [Tulasnella calospora MUT 4182]